MAEAAPPASRRVLLVEGDAALRKDVATLFEQAGLTVLAASGEDGAIAMVEGDHVDLVVASVRLPSGSGTHLVRRLRKVDFRWSRTPALLLTTRDESEIEDLRADIPSQDWVVLPIEPRALLDLAQARLNPRTTGAMAPRTTGAMAPRATGAMAPRATGAIESPSVAEAAPAPRSTGPLARATGPLAPQTPAPALKRTAALPAPRRAWLAKLRDRAPTIPLGVAIAVGAALVAAVFYASWDHPKGGRAYPVHALKRAEVRDVPGALTGDLRGGDLRVFVNAGEYRKAATADRDGGIERLLARHRPSGARRVGIYEFPNGTLIETRGAP